jgi:transcriptional antiterminator NusG
LIHPGASHRVESKPVRRAPRGLYMIGQVGGDGWSGSYGWYAVKTAPNSERPLIEYLRENKDEFMAGLEHREFEVFTPMEVVTVRNGRGKTRGKPEKVMKPFFPGYIFVKVGMCGDFCRRMRTEKGVRGFVTGALDCLPKRLPDAEMEALQRHGPFKIEKPKRFQKGDPVRVVEGPFASFLGVIEEVDKHDRIKVFVEIFGRSTPVEFGPEGVERVASRHSRAPA